jgi:hypothetical protein
VIQKAQDDDNSDAEEDDEDDANAIDQALKIEAEDIHLSSKVVLQRQFFEAIARSASVKFANRSDLPTLSSKLDVLFKNLLIPNAGKSKAKTSDEEKHFKIADKVFEEYETQLLQVFKYFSKKKGPSFFGTQDLTVTVQDLITMFKKTNILDGKKMQLHELLMIIEKYYSSENKLETKLSNENFNRYLRENPMLLKSNRDAQAKKDAGEDEKDQEEEV